MWLEPARRAVSAAKLILVGKRSGLVERQHLTARIEQSATPGRMLVAALAGCGEARFSGQEVSYPACLAEER